MEIRTSDRALAYLTLLCGLTISAVAIWYSVAGLVAIFAAAALPIIIMGTVLEISKLVATVWLKWNWKRAPVLIRTYLLTAIAVLMLLTSMGIFGFLSKAHLDQAVPTGDVAAKVSLLDEKIKTERDNIDSAKRALAQMDATVDQTIARSTNETGATRAAQLRRSQQKERAQLQGDIAKSQKAIATLNEERAPIAADLRKVEAEVGPIKYIAALIYGDSPDNNLLEKAVRWVIIIIVLVFDPLAVILLLASQYSFQWFRQEKQAKGDSPTTEREVDTDDQSTVTTKVEPTNNQPVVAPVPNPIEQDYSFIEENNKRLEEEMAEVLVKEEPPKEEVIEVVKEEMAEVLVKEEPPKEEVIEVVKEEVVEVVKEEPPKEEVVKVVEEIVETVPQESVLDDELLDTESLAEKEAMKRWKEENPRDSLKHQRKLFEMKLIDKLPWQDYLVARPDYVQNEEQNNKTLWQRLKDIKK
jgi:hypothetical protein